MREEEQELNPLLSLEGRVEEVEEEVKVKASRAYPPPPPALLCAALRTFIRKIITPLLLFVSKKRSNAYNQIPMLE